MSQKLPPVAPIHPHSITQHGQTRVDNYFWLRERENPAVLAYLEAENDYLAQVMAPTEALQAELYAEMRGRIKEADSSMPERRGEYWYYTRVEAGMEYPIYCRTHGENGPEEVLLDQNQLAIGHEYCRIGVFRVSPDHTLLAYSVDVAGDEIYTLFVKDLRTGQLLDDQVPNTYYSVEWANDNHTLFYNVLDDAKRPFQLFRHTLGSDASKDPLVYYEVDDSFFLEVTRTRSNAFLLLQLHSNNTSEVRFLSADDPNGTFTMLNPRRSGVEYYVEHHGERFLIWTNDEAQNFKLVEASISNPAQRFWREVVGHRDDVLIDRVDAFQDFVVLYEREAGLPQIRITNPQLHHGHRVDFPEPVYTFHHSSNPEFSTTTLRFTYSSLVTPDSVVDFDMAARSWQVKKQDEIPSGYNPELYVSERRLAVARDGAEIPISLVYKRGLERDGQNPMLLYGYGSYGVTIEPAFATKRLSLLDRGFVYAIAHIRGGTDLGRAWYDNGKLLHKKNTFTDFIACAELLIADGYTSPERLGINGRSAGGLLMGAVTTMRPDLFGAVIAGVPFVDVINTMSDPSLPLTVTEYDEWGNPADPTFFEYMLSYSPYDNTEARDYPHLLATSGLNDPRVSYWEPTKWVAKLRALKTDDHMLLLKTNMDFGHFGASGRFDHLKEDALEYAFLITTLGVATS